MSFGERHPYLSKQLIGWGTALADFIFLCVSALLDFGEWCYPIIVFTFIFAAIMILFSPVIVYFSRRKLVPNNKNLFAERFIRGKIFTIARIRGFKTKNFALKAILALASFIGGIVGSFFVLDISVLLAFASLIGGIFLGVVVLLVADEVYVKNFYTVKNGESLVFIETVKDIQALCLSDAPAFIFSSEPSPVILNFFYNWLKPYMTDNILTVCVITAKQLCETLGIAGISALLEYEDSLLIIPKEQFMLSDKKEELLLREFTAVASFPLSELISLKNEYDESEDFDELDELDGFDDFTDKM